MAFRTTWSRGSAAGYCTGWVLPLALGLGLLLGRLLAGVMERRDDVVSIVSQGQRDDDICNGVCALCPHAPPAPDESLAVVAVVGHMAVRKYVVCKLASPNYSAISHQPSRLVTFGPPIPLSPVCV